MKHTESDSWYQSENKALYVRITEATLHYDSHQQQNLCQGKYIYIYNTQGVEVSVFPFKEGRKKTPSVILN